MIHIALVASSNIRYKMYGALYCVQEICPRAPLRRIGIVYLYIRKGKMNNDNAERRQLHNQDEQHLTTLGRHRCHGESRCERQDGTTAYSNRSHLSLFSSISLQNLGITHNSRSIVDDLLELNYFFTKTTKDIVHIILQRIWYNKNHL